MWQFAILAALLIPLSANPLRADPVQHVDTMQAGACSSFRSATSKVRTSHLDLNEAAAIDIAKHIQKACKVITEIQKIPALVLNPKLSKALIVTGERLTSVLDKIYQVHPALRGKDFVGSTSAQSTKLPVKPCIGPLTAIHLRWFFAKTLSAYAKIQAVTPCKGDMASCSKFTDLVAEMGFAADPIYKAYPDLWHLQMREVPKQKRTKESDDQFRKLAPKPGSVRLTPAASSRIRQFMNSLNKESGIGCQVATLGWTLSSGWKGPNDKDWKKFGPSVDMGAFGCEQIPPDVIRNIDGLRIIFQGDTAQRFEGKTVDFDKGHFVLRSK